MKASMGPRSENRGYPPSSVCRVVLRPGFNGSTVREPWLSPKQSPTLFILLKLQWVHCPRTVVIRGQRRRSTSTGRLALQWVHGPRTVVILT